MVMTQPGIHDKSLWTYFNTCSGSKRPRSQTLESRQCLLARCFLVQRHLFHTPVASPVPLGTRLDHRANFPWSLVAHDSGRLYLETFRFILEHGWDNSASMIPMRRPHEEMSFQHVRNYRPLTFCALRLPASSTRMLRTEYSIWRTTGDPSRDKSSLDCGLRNLWVSRTFTCMNESDVDTVVCLLFIGTRSWY